MLRYEQWIRENGYYDINSIFGTVISSFYEGAGNVNNNKLVDKVSTANKVVSIAGGALAVVGLGALAVATAPVSLSVAAVAGLLVQ